MKRMLLFTGVVAVSVMLAGPAMGVTLPAGTLAASVFDRSSLWELDGGTWDPIATGDAPSLDDEQRTVYSVNAIDFGVVTSGAFPDITNTGPSASGYVTNTLSGMAYDLVIKTITDGGLSPNDNLLFVAGGRYKDSTSGGGTDGTWADKYVSPAYGAATTAAGFGGLLVIYDGPKDHADVTLGHGAWVEEGGPASSDGALDDSDAYPTISHVGAVASTAARQPWLIGVFVPLGGIFGTTVLYEGATTPSGWKGFGYVNVIGGTYASTNLIQQDTFGPYRDVRLNFDVDYQTTVGGVPILTDGWQTFSDDPVGIHILPEPATMTLLGLGLAGLGGVGALRRRRK